MSEINRPSASVTDAVSLPALPTCMNTSNGCPPGLRVIVVNIVPSGVGIR